MALSRLTCPICLSTLKPAQPVAEGARVRCPKCKGAFTAEGEPRAAEPEPEPEPVQEPMPSAAAPPEEEVAEVLAADEEEEAPRRRRRPERDRDDEEDRPSKRVKKGGVPLWVWLTGGGVALVLLCGCCGGGGLLLYNSHMLGGNVSLANYNQIKKGMSEAQVKAILGAPTSVSNAFLMHTDTWKSGDDFIIVSFVNDQAIVGRCHITSPVNVDVQGALP